MSQRHRVQLAVQPDRLAPVVGEHRGDARGRTLDECTQAGEVALRGFNTLQAHAIGRESLQRIDAVLAIRPAPRRLHCAPAVEFGRFPALRQLEEEGQDREQDCQAADVLQQREQRQTAEPVDDSGGNGLEQPARPNLATRIGREEVAVLLKPETESSGRSADRRARVPRPTSACSTISVRFSPRRAPPRRAAIRPIVSASTRAAAVAKNAKVRASCDRTRIGCRN